MLDEEMSQARRAAAAPVSVNRAATTAATATAATTTTTAAVGSHAPDLRGLAPGFADPVGSAQAVFRAALHAMSHPGQVVGVDAEAASRGVPPGLSPAMTALVLTLADSDTPLWLAEDGDAAQRFFRFHCGAPFVTDPALARFVVVPSGGTVPSFAECDPGDPAYPDRSATLLIEVASLHGDITVRLRGPGIADTQALGVVGLAADFWPQWRAQGRRFPLGVDVFLTCGSQFCALPRTTTLVEC